MFGRKVTLYTILIGFMVYHARGSPKLKWPLCDLSFSYEVKFPYDGIYPKLTDCFEVDEGSRFTSGASGKALYFSGALSAYVEVSIPSGNLKTTDFGFSVFIKPVNLFGYILHYKADAVYNNRITNVFLDLQPSGAVHFYLQSSNGNNLGEVTGGQITSDAWSLIQIGFKSNSLLIKINGAQVASNSISSVSFQEPGTLRLGSSQTHNSNYYIGSMTCLMAYDDASALQTKAETEEECKDYNNWGKKPYNDFTPPSCTLPPSPPPTQTSLLLKPVYAWPLDNNAYGYDVINKMAPDCSDLSLCPRIEKNNSVFPFPAMIFDGAGVSYIKTSYNRTMLQTNFTIGLFIHPSLAVSGTVLHIIEAGQNIGIEQLKVQIDMCNLTVIVLENRTSICSRIEANNLQISTWNELLIQRNVNNQKLTVTMNNVTLSADDNCGVREEGNSAVIYIGKSQTGFTSFHGLLRCLLVYDGITPISNSICTNSSISPFSDSDTVCKDVNMKRMYFKKKFNYKKPDISTPMISLMDVNRLKTCALQCLTKRFCRAFVFDSVLSQCFLYDFVTINGLVNTTSGHYYIVINKS